MLIGFSSILVVVGIASGYGVHVAFSDRESEVGRRGVVRDALPLPMEQHFTISTGVTADATVALESQFLQLDSAWFTANTSAKRRRFMEGDRYLCSVSFTREPILATSGVIPVNESRGCHLVPFASPALRVSHDKQTTATSIWSLWLNNTVAHQLLTITIHQLFPTERSTEGPVHWLNHLEFRVNSATGHIKSILARSVKHMTPSLPVRVKGSPRPTFPPGFVPSILSCNENFFLNRYDALTGYPVLPFPSHETRIVERSAALVSATFSYSVTLDATDEAPVFVCDEGLYMGFTNFIQSIANCIIAGQICGYRVEYPAAFQNAEFGDLFDEATFVAGINDRFGVDFRFVRGRSRTSPPHMVHSLWLYKEQETLSQFCAARNSTVHAGDVWRSQISVVNSRFLSDFILRGMLVPSTKLTRAIEPLSTLVTIRSLAYDRRQELQAATGLIAVHLRFESDRWVMEKKTSSNQTVSLEDNPDFVRVLRDINDLVDQTSRSQPANVPAVRVYVAAGNLGRSKTNQSLVPDAWIHKHNVLNASLWSRSFEGEWFDGNRLNITNGTGSYIDFLVLMSADISVVAEFSSFGEFVAALRCEANLPTYFYGLHKDFFRANCKYPILYTRLYRERLRRCRTGECKDKVMGEIASHKQRPDEFFRNAARWRKDQRRFRPTACEVTR